MKQMKNIYKVAMILATMMAVSCSHPQEEEPIRPSGSLFTITEHSFSGIAGQQSLSIEFNAPQPWTAQILTVSSWIEADALRGGAGKATISLKPRSDNFGTAARTATLLVSIDGYEPYQISLQQLSAATDLLTISAKTNADGVITLKASDSGTEFTDTIIITSSSAWSLSADSNVGGILSFQHDSDPVNGTETSIPVIVKASYSQFPSSSFEGTFYVNTPDGKAAPVKFQASASVEVFGESHQSADQPERISYELTDTMQAGVFMAGFFVESNIRWHLGDIPEWIETAQDWGSNVSEVNNVMRNGNINPARQPVYIRIKQKSLSIDGRSGTISILDDRGHTIKTVYITFAGVGNSYISHNLALPAEDPYGNPWGFEASEALAGADPSHFWEQTSREFSVTVSADFSSIEDAPFHMILVQAKGGIAAREEVHWAHLEMGSPETSRDGELYTRNLVIRSSDRGDADDTDGLTDPTQWRQAFMFLVPRSVQFDDLWNADGTLKNTYYDRMTLISQKNDPLAQYSFGFRQVTEGDTVYVSPWGESLPFDILPDSYTMCELEISVCGQDGEWTAVSASVFQADIRIDSLGNPEKVVFSISANNGERNPFTGQVTGSDRLFRVEVYAFLGDDVEHRKLLTFYFSQQLNK